MVSGIVASAFENADIIRIWGDCSATRLITPLFNVTFRRNGGLYDGVPLYTLEMKKVENIAVARVDRDLDQFFEQGNELILHTAESYTICRHWVMDFRFSVMFDAALGNNALSLV